ncbi:zf-HC2 domain-containing protein [Corynebacterium caspium]|uniref:zf-HC2 domain-containing protein n=1 Tax=Corynebacterium caspium TaxID=234828 RepID=UPI00036A21E1|nr:zf-HC2 domain-containing protein [Corynebacterium caspium]WKD59609.1 hypothetical protein CCASP_06120 [Corynebacterium caspium DSM 44850]
MKHEEIQASISARLDGEAPLLADDIVAAHLTACPECRDFFQRATALQGALKQPSPTPDLTAQILAQAGPAWRRGPGTRLVIAALARIGLLVHAIFFIIWGVQLLIGSQPDAAVRIAVACALVYGAWRPAILAGLLPFLGSWAMFSTGLEMRNIFLGQANIAALVFLFSSAICAGLAWWFRDYRQDSSWLNANLATT